MALATGILVALMSATGIAIAFEDEILDWVDHDTSTVSVPKGQSRLSVDQLIDLVQRERPEFAADYLVIPKEQDAAFAFMHEYHELLHVDPYSGEIRETRRADWQSVLWKFESLHRFLGMQAEGWWQTGRLINGVANLSLLFLCLSGIYLWFPRRMTYKALHSGWCFISGARGRARNYNWHKVFGFWSFLVLTMLAATGVVISFEWGHRLVFILAGEEAPESRSFGMMNVPSAEVPPPPPSAKILSYEQLLGSVREAYPEWQQISFELPVAKDDEARIRHSPVTMHVVLPDHMPSRAWIPVELDPFTGRILQMIHFNDRSPGLRARVWIRFLHTGAAYGIWGKIIVSLASIAAVIMVYTGFALSYHRFFGRSKHLVD